MGFIVTRYNNFCNDIVPCYVEPMQLGYDQEPGVSTGEGTVKCLAANYGNRIGLAITGIRNSYTVKYSFSASCHRPNSFIIEGSSGEGFQAFAVRYIEKLQVSALGRDFAALPLLIGRRTDVQISGHYILADAGLGAYAADLSGSQYLYCG